MSANPPQRLIAYGLVVVALCAIAWTAPRAWATPEQARSGQTVPTATPVKVWSPSPSPDHDEPTATPQSDPATPAAPELTSVPPSAATPTATGPAAGAGLSLTQGVTPLLAWPGVKVDYVLTVRNTGAASLREVVLEDALPEGLDPAAVQGAAWEGRVLRARVALLPPGGQRVVRFSALVRADAVQGGLLVNRAQVAAPGASIAQAEAAIVLPPVTLPVVGDALDSRTGRR